MKMIDDDLNKEIQYMKEMINDIKEFIKLNNNFIIKMRITRNYIFSEDIMTDINEKSIKQAMKFIHQIWTSILIVKLLNSRQIYRIYFKQGARKTDPPSLIFKNDRDVFYLWHEYQYIGEKPKSSDLSNERLKIGPETDEDWMWRRRDIMLIKSKNGETDFLKIKGNDFSKADLVIECKHLPIEKWLLNQEMFDNLLKSLRAYKEFPPKTDNILLISIFEIPFDYKNRLEKEGITIIDGFHPNNLNKIKEFENYLIKILS